MILFQTIANYTFLESFKTKEYEKNIFGPQKFIVT